MTPFHVGMMVVCVSSKWTRPPSRGEVYPTEGQVYTIRDMEPSRSNTACGVHLQFDELRNPELDYNTCRGECSFNGDKFRPVVKTDISVFEAMLSKPPVPKRVPADA